MEDISSTEIQSQPAAPSDAVGVIGTNIAIGLAALAASVFFLFQLNSVSSNSRLLVWQMDNANKQITALEEALKRAQTQKDQRDVLVQQVINYKTEIDKILGEVIDLAKTDSDAAEIVKAFGLQRVGNQEEGTGTSAEPAKKP